jgi:hypothetical protein
MIEVGQIRRANPRPDPVNKSQYTRWEQLRKLHRDVSEVRLLPAGNGRRTSINEHFNHPS